MMKKLKNKVRSLFKILNQLLTENIKFRSMLVDQSESSAFQMGELLVGQLKLKGAIRHIQDAEFKVFSQWGDDGIIQYLVSHLDLSNDLFIEFGVEDYRESNTRFLLMNNNWRGLVFDGSSAHIENIKKSQLHWKYDLTAKHAFITAENINSLILNAGFSGEIGLLHIDIDGNDYWVWKALNVVQPVIVIVEYNSVFGRDRCVTVPYREDFVRSKAHYSHLYAGVSLASLCDLALEKGYSFVGSNSAGNNAYFIKKGYEKDLPVLKAEEGYVLSKFRESRNKKGELTYIGGNARIEEIRGLPVFNTRTNQIEEI